MSFISKLKKRFYFTAAKYFRVFANHSLKRWNPRIIAITGPVPLPTKRSTFTVVKSPHVYKTGGEAFEMKVHKRLIDISNATPKTIDSLQNLSLPAGVDAEIKM